MTIPLGVSEDFAFVSAKMSPDKGEREQLVRALSFELGHPV
ncbi:MAG TPA: hypothetical protein VMU99_02750 [Acidimicrobiales bacterium]|nr:hypothetical protein [Acidimicrobiales bacterium]